MRQYISESDNMLYEKGNISKTVFHQAEKSECYMCGLFMALIEDRQEEIWVSNLGQSAEGKLTLIP